MPGALRAEQGLHVDAVMHGFPAESPVWKPAHIAVAWKVVAVCFGTPLAL